MCTFFVVVVVAVKHLHLSLSSLWSQLSMLICVVLAVKQVHLCLSLLSQLASLVDTKAPQLGDDVIRCPIDELRLLQRDGALVCVCVCLCAGGGGGGGTV